MEWNLEAAVCYLWELRMQMNNSAVSYFYIQTSVRKVRGRADVCDAALRETVPWEIKLTID